MHKNNLTQEQEPQSRSSSGYDSQGYYVRDQESDSRLSSGNIRDDWQAFDPNDIDVMSSNPNHPTNNNTQEPPSLWSKTTTFFAFGGLSLVAFTAYGVTVGIKNGVSEFGAPFAQTLPLLASACQACTQGVYADLIYTGTAIVTSALAGGSAALIQKCREPKSVARSASNGAPTLSGEGLQLINGNEQLSYYTRG